MLGIVLALVTLCSTLYIVLVSISGSGGFNLLEFFQLKSGTEISEDKMVLKDYQKINKDVHIIISFTDRKLPVVQSKDNEDYVHKNYKKEYDKYGTPMIDYTSSASADNIIINAHSSSKSDVMFTPFKNKDYILANKTYNVETVDGNKTVQLVSYFLVDLSADDADLSWLQTNWRNSSEMSRYIDSVITKSEIDFNINISEVEQIVTLVTCDLSKDNARFILVGVISGQ